MGQQGVSCQGRDEEGYLFLVDRKANMIISAGENIFPSEVENVVGGHPKMKDVAAIGIPHEKWGETILGIVVLYENQSATPEDITNFSMGKIAGYKVPKNVGFIADDEMPRTANGKILHRVLREKYGMWKDHQWWGCSSDFSPSLSRRSYDHDNDDLPRRGRHEKEER